MESKAVFFFRGSPGNPYEFSPRPPGLSTMDAEIAAEIAPGARFGPHDDQFLAWSMLILGERKKTHGLQGLSTPCIGDGKNPTFNRNPYGYINPYYWVDDHAQLYGNNGSWSTLAHMDCGERKRVGSIHILQLFIAIRLKHAVGKTRGCQPKNRGGPPKSLILIGFSIINKPSILGYLYFWVDTYMDC